MEWNLDRKQTFLRAACAAAAVGAFFVSGRLYRVTLGAGAHAWVARGLMEVGGTFLIAPLLRRVPRADDVPAGRRDLWRALPLLILFAAVMEVIRAIF